MRIIRESARRLGAHIEAVAKAHGFEPYADLCRRVGINNEYFRQIRRGQRMPSRRVLENLIFVLDPDEEDRKVFTEFLYDLYFRPASRIFKRLVFRK